MAGKLKSCDLNMLLNIEVHLLNRRITCMTVPAMVEAIYNACVAGRKITVSNYNVHSFNLSMQLPWFYNFLQTSDIVHCDSMGILKAIRCLGLDLPIQYRASYTLLMPELLKKCNEHSFSCFFLGSRNQYLQMALERLTSQYPNVTFAGHHGYFSIEDPNQNEAVIEQINFVKPHILVVGMGMPTQENWISLYRNRLNVNVMMLGGAVIDRLAGVVTDCPALLSNMGCEWLYRLCREPKRLAVRYLLGNPAFMLHIALAKFSASSTKALEIKSNNSSILESKDILGNFNSKSTTHANVKRLGDYLVEAGLLTQVHIDSALSEQKITGMRLGEILVQKGLIKEQTIEYLVENVIRYNRGVKN